jgi:hypothetical protein
MKTGQAAAAEFKPQSPCETKFGRNRLRRPDLINLREMAIIIGVVAIALRVLPRPLDLLTAFTATPLYFLSRIYPTIFRPLDPLWYMAWAIVPYVPAWVSGERSDVDLAKAFLLLTAPSFARFVIWRDWEELWPALDSLVIATALPAIGAVACLLVRLFEVGALSFGICPAPFLGISDGIDFTGGPR